MASSSVIRESRYIWYLRIVQFITCLVALGVAGQTATGWGDIECSVPQNISFNLAVAIITLPALIYLFFTTGRFANIGFWWFWAQIGVDAFFIIMWIAAAGTSGISCGDICSACTAGTYGEPFTVFTYDWGCDCPDGTLISKKRSVGGRVALRMGSIAVKQGFQGLMIFCFFSVLITALGIRFGWWRSRNQNANQTNPEMNDGPQKYEVDAAAHFTHNVG